MHTMAGIIDVAGVGYDGWGGGIGAGKNYTAVLCIYAGFLIGLKFL